MDLPSKEDFVEILNSRTAINAICCMSISGARLFSTYNEFGQYLIYAANLQLFRKRRNF